MWFIGILRYVKYKVLMGKPLAGPLQPRAAFSKVWKKIKLQACFSHGSPWYKNILITRDPTSERVKDCGEFRVHRGHKSLCFSIVLLYWLLLSRFPIVRFHWVQSNLASSTIMKSHRTVHVPIGCYLSFQISHFPRCNFNASKSLPATSLFVSANRL